MSLKNGIRGLAVVSLLVAGLFFSASTPKAEASGSVTFVGTASCTTGSMARRPMALRIVRDNPSAGAYTYAFSLVDGSSSHMEAVSTSEATATTFFTAISMSYAPSTLWARYTLRGAQSGTSFVGTIDGSFNTNRSCTGSFVATQM